MNFLVKRYCKPTVLKQKLLNSKENKSMKHFLSKSNLINFVINCPLILKGLISMIWECFKLFFVISLKIFIMGQTVLTLSSEHCIMDWVNFSRGYSYLLPTFPVFSIFDTTGQPWNEVRGMALCKPFINSRNPFIDVKALFFVLCIKPKGKKHLDNPKQHTMHVVQGHSSNYVKTINHTELWNHFDSTFLQVGDIFHENKWHCNNSYCKQCALNKNNYIKKLIIILLLLQGQNDSNQAGEKASMLFVSKTILRKIFFLTRVYLFSPLTVPQTYKLILLIK